MLTTTVSFPVFTKRADRHGLTLVVTELGLSRLNGWPPPNVSVVVARLMRVGEHVVVFDETDVRANGDFLRFASNPEPWLATTLTQNDECTHLQSNQTPSQPPPGKAS